MNSQEYEYALRDLDRDYLGHLHRLHDKHRQELANAAQWHSDAIARLLSKCEADSQEDGDDGNTRKTLS